MTMTLVSASSTVSLESNCNENGLIQRLGYASNEEIPSTIGSVSIDHSNNVHFGDKNFYNGPVTIKQIVYANGDAAIQCDTTGTDTTASDVDEVGDEQSVPKIQTGKVSEPGYLWIQNVSQHRRFEIGMSLVLVILLVIAGVTVLVLKKSKPIANGSTTTPGFGESGYIKPIDYQPDLSPGSDTDDLRIISRQKWLAQPPISNSTLLITPVPYVIIHHTASENCSSQSQCIFYVRNIQTFHIESNGWDDIGYNFLVGGDGSAYEGRGWTKIGAHLKYWNTKSIGIAFIGTFISSLPPNRQLSACEKLIKLGVKMGYIQEDYKLLGARQLFGTESPGKALYELIETWPHWVQDPNI